MAMLFRHIKLSDSIIKTFTAKGAAENYLSRLGLSLEKGPPSGFSTNQSHLKPLTETKLFEAMQFLKYWIDRTSGSSKIKLVQMREAIRNRIICANIGLIYRCMQLTSVHADTDTLLGAGHIAILEAAEMFNPYLGIRFSTYASVSILRRFSREIKRKQLPINDSTETEDVVDKDSADERDEKHFLVEKLHRLLDSETGVLTQDDVQILTLRFNLGNLNSKKKTLDAVAKLRGKSKERIRQLQAEAIKKLRTAFEIVW